MADTGTKNSHFKRYVLNWRPSPLREKIGTPKLALSPRFDSTLLPSSKDLSKYDSPVKDQGELGACTAFAAIAVVEHIANRNGKKSDWSELYLYYNTRVKVLGWPATDDTGAYVSATMMSLYGYGNAGESDWPYDISNFASEPPRDSYTRGSTNQVIKTAFLESTVDSFRASIASGYPVDIGFICYSNLYDFSQSGEIPMPKPGTYIIGGHSVTIIGYDDSSRLFKFKNSWGTDFGEGGYGYLPYEYVSAYTTEDIPQKLVSDAWTIISIEFDSDFVILDTNPPERLQTTALALTTVTA